MAEAVPVVSPELTSTASTVSTKPAPVPHQVRSIGPDHVVDAPMSAVETWARLLLGLSWVGICSVLFVFVLFLFLPSRPMRIRVGNVYGSIAGGGACWLTGSRFVIKGEEHADPKRPTLYLCNHASILDVFLGIWMSRDGTCGVAKKEIVYYPFLGQFFWLAGHLTIDRSNNAKAVDALQKLVDFVLKNRLSIYIWPEGTRGKDGRLQPFKRGAFHMALASKLPIVPIVLRGTHRAWPNRSFRLNRTTVEAEFLPPIETAHWTRENLDQHIQEIHDVYKRALPEDQQPLAGTAGVR